MTVRVNSDLRDLVISQNDAVLGVEGDKRITFGWKVPNAMLAEAGTVKTGGE